MLVKKISLRSFRNYTSAVLVPAEGITVLHGKNGAGKTNLLEGIHLCALGRSHRVSKDSDMIKSGEERARVTVSCVRTDGRHEVSVTLGSTGQRAKQVLINNKAPRRLGEMMGHVTCVIFSPEDLQLVREGPSFRRRFMDMLLSQRSNAYFYALQKYVVALGQRNALLRAMRGIMDEAYAPQLAIWEEQLAREGAEILRGRYRLAVELERLAAENYAYLAANERERLRLRYRGAVAAEENQPERLLALLEKNRAEDVRRGVTGIGPHRDDLLLTLSQRDMRTFASQGQVRSAALAMKLSEITLLTESHGETPVLLLDDVMSELDMDRRRLLLSRISGIQTLVTCTDESDFPKERVDKRVLVCAGEDQAELNDCSV